MKTQLSGVLIAVAILVAAFILRPQTNSFSKLLDQLNEVSSKDGESEKSKVEKLFYNVSSSIAGGYSAGRDNHHDFRMKRDREFIRASEKVKLLEVQLLKKSDSYHEYVIGRLKNNYELPISAITLNIMYFDASGKLIDVFLNFPNARGALKPNEELGFKVERRLVSYQAKLDERDAARSSSIKVSVSGFRIIK